MIAPRETWNTCSTLSQKISFRRVPIWQWLMKNNNPLYGSSCRSADFLHAIENLFSRVRLAFFRLVEGASVFTHWWRRATGVGWKSHIFTAFSFGRSSRGVVYDTTWNSFETSGFQLHTVTSISSQSFQSHLTSHKANSIQSNFRGTQRNLLHHSHLALRQLFHFLQ